MPIFTSGRWQTSSRQQVLLWLVVLVQAVIFSALLAAGRVQAILAPFLAGMVLMEASAATRIAEYRKLNQRWGTFREALQGTATGTGALLGGLGFLLLGAGILINLSAASTPTEGRRLAGVIFFAGVGLALLALGIRSLVKCARARKARP